ncbi:catalase family peroxidase [Gallaecimonas mangrovi]|uniref:catalase family peroxidase n=1 Tax=Gallaecimonas mangrovi TaxID=2291597 RepID=UPI000E204C8F|nr:catalase family peroxidase [Gallaecimonas mangrovi]
MNFSSTWQRWAIIALAVAIPALVFAYVAGWLAPQRLTPGKFVNQLETDGGVHPGMRRNHTKGLCVSGYFVSNGNGERLSSAPLFSPGQYPVTGRFSLPGGNPHGDDAKAAPRALGLRINAGLGQQWRMAMLSSPVFLVATPQAFFTLLKDKAPDPATGKPDGAKIAAFFKAHPETAPFLKWAKEHKRSDSFASTPFNSLDSFVFTNNKGQSHFVRWRFLPQTAFAPQPADAGNDFLFNDIAKRLEQGPVKWQLQVQVANPGDPVLDATKAWPAARQHIDVGTLVLTRSQSQDTGACGDLNFDPTILPSGMAPSDDPLLPARSAVYSNDFTRRLGERAKMEKQS